ncbi:hypothetical protein Patl1_07428 [Pistacia atlantica]|uniref:Uncharacterized protein n=1 Tax=Pistacia atlantica TaxID=434234 RepID=A0ACC1AJ82_9ROSI|nr:hypothetical protein Patl1_07428 [Pistacia atlantica]
MLTCIHLKDCHNLKKIPDITMAPNFEELYFEGCPRLLEIYSPLLVHKKLIQMKVSNCSSLTTLPRKIHMGSLEVLDVFCREKVEKFPKIVGNMERLWHLRFDGTAIKDVPLSIDFLPGLQQTAVDFNQQ